MTVKTVYKVSFRGVILPGFDKDQVIENVHNITRIPKHTITRKFFSGKTVVIRHANSQEYADRLQKTFAQAGIETYINESEETVSETTSEAISEEPLSELESPEPAKPEKSHLPAILISVITIALVVIAFFFLKNDFTPQVKGSASQADGSNPADSSNPTNGSNKKEPIENTPPTPFFIAEQLEGLIKITDKSELERLSQFSTFFDVNENYFNFIKQEINSVFTISRQSPVYIFKIKSKTINQTGILLNLSNQQTHIAQLEKKMDAIKNNSALNSVSLKNACKAPVPEINIIRTKNHLLLTTINKNSQKLKVFEKLSDQEQLNASLLALDELFYLTPESKNASFNFFYHNKYFTDKKTNDTNYFALSANNENFWFSTNKNSYNKINDLLNTFKINSDSKIKISSFPDKNLFNFTLLMMAQSYPGNFSISKQVNPTSGQMSEQIMFAQEQIVKIEKNYSFNDIRPYTKEFDIEFLPQWQSGPFALATNQFKFGESLVIEILAKGQNIHNLMEYSHSALLRIHSVLNTNNENILTQDFFIQDCPKLINADKNVSDTYFRDTDGEQEAYVNDDFLSYQTISAKKEIQIQAGYNDTDINLIEGEIILQLPDQIMQKTIALQKNTAYSHFDNFSLFIKHIPETDTLQYNVIGNTNSFITLRAYNDADEVIDTRSLERQTLINKQLNFYQQEFSKAIKTIKIFYTKGNTIKNYPFAFKPEILPGKGKTTAMVTAQNSQPVSFSHDELLLPPLKEEILNDNPAWLGQKWQGENSSQNSNSPFYVNLFIHENSNTDNEKQGLSSVRENVLDAVLNIKSSQSPFISQNITAVKLTLLEGNTTLLDNFISFNNNELFEDGAEPKVIPYLNSNSAFELSKDFFSKDPGFKDPGSPKDQAKHLHGHITLSLPNSFKSHSKKYTFLGQVIKLDGILVKTIQLNKHQIQFEIQGDIKNLVQLKLYNSNNNLISELFEFKHINKNKALLTLLYNDKINNIKLVLSQESTIKEYPFSF